MLKVLLAKIELLIYWISTWKLELDFEKEVNSNINMNTYVDSFNVIVQDEDQKLANGTYLMKQAVRRAAKTGNTTLDALLKQVDDMLDFARHETEEQKRLREIKESIYVRKEKDIKTEEDYIKMIGSRIKMYEDLHKHKLQRKLNSEIRKARRDGNEELYNKLLGEYNEKYGRGKN